MGRAEPDYREGGGAPRAEGGGWWQGLCGAVAAGLAVLSVVVLVTGCAAWLSDVPGPEVGFVLGHLGIAAAALLAQRKVDTGERPEALAGAAAVVLLALGGLFLLWA
jgi:hypothetical protein